MKKSLLFILPALLLSGCLPLPNNSSSTPSSEVVSSSGQSTQPTSITSSPTSQSTTPTSSSSSSSSTPTPVITLQKINKIKADKKIGELVSFKATYLRRIAFVSTDLLFFADDTDSIGFRIQSGIDYIQNTYRFRECKVTGKLVEYNGNLEVQFDSSFGTYQESLVRLGDNEALSYNENKTTLPVALNSISDIKDISGNLTLDKKSYGYSDQLIKFTAQYVQNENDNSSEKLMFLDSFDKSIVVIQDGDGTGGHPLYDLRNTENIGKYYEIIGIVSVRYSIPAVLGLKATYVSKSSEEETTVDVSKAVEVTEEVKNTIFKGNLTTDKFSPLKNEDYYHLYHATGWVSYNKSVTTTLNFGLAFEKGFNINGSGGTSTIRAFYFVNGTSIKNTEYCVFDEYLDMEIDVYFKIESYHNQNHCWKIFVIEGLLPEVY